MAAARQKKPQPPKQLPRWNLKDLYPGPNSTALKKDLAKAKKDSTAFHKKYFGKTGKLSGIALGGAVKAYEKIDETLSRVMSYAQLVHAADVADPEIARFYQTTQEAVTDIAAHLVFFTLEINQISDAALKKKLKAPSLAHYASWIRDVRVFRPHELDEEMERLLHDKRVAGRAAWNRLFDETMARMRIDMDGKQKTTEEVLHSLSDTKGEVRKKAAKALGRTFGDHIQLFSLITNTLAKDKEIDDRWRSYARPQSSRNLANHVEDEVVDALSAAVRKSYPDLSHRYYKLKARWFSKRKLDYWDRNAPLPDAGGKEIPWDTAKSLVLDAYGAFSPDLAKVGKQFFDKPWIDAAPRPGKAGGAFAHPTVPSAHPYLLVNYMGRPRDVMTLAHELGHGCHQVLAGPQGHLKCDTPLTLAETASVFGEMLTFRSLLAGEKNPARRKAMLAGKVEDMLNTVVRQIAFYEFELRVHTERREGELSADRICDIWMDIQGESLGPAIRFHDEYKYFWTYIPHFIHSPFYVYAYAFGDCLVNSLYAVYENANEGFAERYLDMLRAGGTLHHKELLAPFGLNASDPKFWSKGLGVVSGLIDELEEIG
ncbi:MAG: M3 family oligoendopeptidase [Alphaproteobacteria bacterium]|nr:M3 family oligoendopeptidase [Alphaproteobacteria bacterium]